MRTITWLPVTVVLLLAAQVMIWWLIVDSKRDRLEAQLQARLPVITEALRNDALCMQLRTEMALPPGSSFFLLGPSQSSAGLMDTIMDYHALYNGSVRPVKSNSFPLEVPCVVDIDIRFKFMVPSEVGSLTESSEIHDFLTEELGTALWMNKGGHRLKLLDTTLLADLITEQLDLNAFGTVQYAIIDTSEGNLMHASAEANEAELLRSPYHLAIFSQGQIGLPWLLAVSVPDHLRTVMLSEVHWLLALLLLAGGSSLLVRQYINTARAQRKLAAIQIDLVSNISHEFNTPIANITLALETLKKAPSPSSRITNDQLWDIIHMESQRLQGTIRKVMDVSLFENQKISLMEEVHDIHALLHSTIDRFKLRSEQEDVCIRKRFLAMSAWAKVDATYLGHVFQSLIDNAIKYGGRGVIITISTWDTDQGMEVEFSDNGEGIAREDRQRVFEKFYRVRRSDRYAIQGTGIGLYHARQVVEAHGGTLRLMDGPPGGSSFRILIPIEIHADDTIAHSGG